MPPSSTWTATSPRRPASAAAIRCPRRALRGRRPPRRHREDTLVVAYDEAGEAGAARLWWLLRHFGHDAVTVLDGGLRAWREEGGELRAAARSGSQAGRASRPRPRAGRRRSTPRRCRRRRTRRPLLDARAPERYPRRGRADRSRRRAHPRRGERAVRRARAGRPVPPPEELRAALERPACAPATMPSHTAARA